MAEVFTAGGKDQYKKVVAERMVRHSYKTLMERFNMEFQLTKDISLTMDDDQIKDIITYHIVQESISNRIQELREVTHSFPRGVWQHIKAKWAPQWFIKRFPIQFTVYAHQVDFLMYIRMARKIAEDELVPLVNARINVNTLPTRNAAIPLIEQLGDWWRHLKTGDTPPSGIKTLVLGEEKLPPYPISGQQ